MSAISSADWPGALVRIRPHRVPRRLLNGTASARQLRHQLAMRQERYKPLLGGHALNLLVEALAGSFG
jgi:hypothetical protein